MKIPTRPEDYFRNLEKRLSRLERRPNRASMDTASLLGPGIASQAVQIMDWSSSDALFNGFFHSEVGGINSPDSTLTWTGQVIAKDDGTGMQQVWNTDGPETLYWMRTYAPDPADPSLVIFSEWKKFATASGLIGADEIDPDFVDNLPPPDLTDGAPPTEAPVVTPIGGIGSMFFRWNEITNADPVTYRLHVAADRTPLTDGSDEVASGVGLTMASVRELKDGTAIVGDGSVVYHAIVTVEDADTDPADPPVASSEVTGTPAQVTGADIAVNAITSDLLIANDAVVGALNGESITGVTITGPNIRTIANPTQGIHLDADGLRAYAPDKTTPFFEVKPSEGVVITTGKGTFDTLTVNQQSELGGETRIKSGSKLQLTSGTMPPTSAPIVGNTYDTVQFDDDGLWGNRYGWSTDGSFWYTALDTGSGSLIEKWRPDGYINLSVEGYDGSPYEVRGSVVGGGHLWTIAVQDGQWAVGRHSLDTLELDAWMGWWNHNDGDTKTPAIAYDEATGHIIIAQARPTHPTLPGCVRIRRYTLDTSGPEVKPLVAVPSGWYDTTETYNNPLSGLYFGSADLGADRYVLTSRSSGAYRSYIGVNPTATEQLTEQWQSGMANKVGFTYASRSATITTSAGSATVTAAVGTFGKSDIGSAITGPGIPANTIITAAPTSSTISISNYADAGAGTGSGTFSAWKSMDKEGLLRTYTQQDKFASMAAGEEWRRERWVYWTWYRGSAPYETTTSPPQAFIQPKRSKLTVTGPTELPTSPGATDPTGIRFYISTSESSARAEPPRTSQHLQLGQPNSPSISFVYDYIGTSGAAPPDPTNTARTDAFPDAVPSRVIGTKKRSDQITPQVNIPDFGAVTLDGLIPPGYIGMWAGSTAPAGWAMCDGTTKSRTLDRPLYDAIGTTYGAGDGSTTFNLPNFNNKLPIGAGTKALGTTGGSETKTIGVNNLPPHTHGINRADGTGGNVTNVARGSATAVGDATTGNGGFANDPLNIMPPWLAINYIIKL
jgi:microcystin-dependent protein